jgi:hypothetical protein
VTYTYGFTTGNSAKLTSIVFNVPAGTAGTAAVGTVTPAAVAGGSISLSGTSLTYTLPGSGVTVNRAVAISIGVQGLTNSSVAGQYFSQIVTRTATGPNDSGTTPGITLTGLLTLTAPGSLGWSSTLNGLDQSVPDTNTTDQTYTINDATGSGSGWHVSISATTLTNATHSLPNTKVVSTNASLSSAASTTSPTVTCLSAPCTLPANSTVYPVAITTAASSPPSAIIYDTAAMSGLGQISIGGSTTAHPVAWWVSTPASAFKGTYTTTITFSVISAP